ncbi:sensor histidine kinase [Gillisia marina]|uniref:sensor histidine kinase n=1 Tax=Gillisia marina TaxID=1167637 RepID=UPI00029A429E|nr:histidine kinase [Gillisia marina]
MNLLHFKKKYIDGRLILLLAAFYTLFYIVFISKTLYMRAYVYKEVKYSMWEIIIHGYLVDWVIVIAFMSLIAISTKRLIVKKVPWKNIFLLHLLLSIFIGVIIRIVVIFYSVLMGELSLNDLNWRDNVTSFMHVVDLNFLIYFAMILIIYVYYYIDQIREVEEKRGLLEAQLLNTRMQMLTSQLQPHFLFNTLNSISSLVEIDTKLAKDTIADLSDFLREILYNSDAKFITLHKELTVLEYFLNIVNVRFSDHLTIEKEIDPDLMNVNIPAMILQPIVENSIKHGYSYDHTDLEIKIAVLKKNGHVLLKVENNGKQITQDTQELINSGVGLSNLKERLYNLYGDSHSFIMRNKEDGLGVETLIELPIKV